MALIGKLSACSACALLIVAASEATGQNPDWEAQLQAMPFLERLQTIQSVSQLPQATQRDRVPALIRLLGHEDQSVRITAADEIAEIRAVSATALPRLIENFRQPNGEEGMAYVIAVAAFGNQALPQLQQALGSNDWLVRTRACDAIRKIEPRLYSDGECRQKTH